MVVRAVYFESTLRCVEEGGMLGNIEGGFRRGRRTEDNCFMLERII